MEKIANAVVKAFGGKPNGTPETTCFDRWGFTKQVIMALTLAFTSGASVMAMFGSHKELPVRVGKLETQMTEISAKLSMIYDEVRDNRGTRRGGGR